MILTFLEASGEYYGNVSPYIFGGMGLAALIFGLIWVLGMGSGRPNTK